MHLTFFDNINVIILIISLMIGIFKGMITTIVDLILFLTIIALTFWLLPYSYEFLHEYVNNSLAVNILGGIICYVFSMICIYLLSRNIKNLIKPITGGFLDRSLGGVIGIFRGILIINAIFIFGTIANDRKNFPENSLNKIFTESKKNNAKWLAASYSFNMINTSTKAMLYFFPSYIKNMKFNEFELYKSIFEDKEDNAKVGVEEDNSNKLKMNIINSDEELNRALEVLNITTENTEQ